MEPLRRLGDLVTTHFALIMLAAAACALLWPGPLGGLTHLIPPTLGVIMFGMGVSLTTADFARILRRPRDVAMGVAAQYVVMPLLAFLMARLWGLEASLAAGLVLVGACPGGTASNVIVYLAGADLALSVTMTAASTLLSPLMTPLFTLLYAGRWVEVPVWKLFQGTVEMVFVPVVLGVAARRALARRASSLLALTPALSALGIVFVVAVIVSANAGRLSGLGWGVFGAVAAHNVLGLAIGYYVARFGGMDAVRARTVSVEVGMQNSGLGVALSTAYFGPLAALPGAAFSVWHNVTGSLLAWWWRRVRPTVPLVPDRSRRGSR